MFHYAPQFVGGDFPETLIVSVLLRVGSIKGMSSESTSPLPHGDGEGRWPSFRFLKGGIPPAYPAWDLSILRMPAMSRISVGTGEDEKEARRCMSPALSTFAKDKS